MAATSDIKEKTISDLPSEILSHIFSYLPRNIRVIRLVCRRWNQACNNIEVSGNEGISVYYKREFFSRKILSRNIYNLSLIMTHVKCAIAHDKFFKRFGDKLLSLRLIDFEADRFTPILEFCKNVDTLTLTRCTPSIVKLFRCKDGSVVQTNIVSLRIEKCFKWSDETVDACFRACPHLRSLTLKRFSVKPVPSAYEKFYSLRNSQGQIRSFSGIYNALSIRAADLLELNIHQVDGILPEQFEQIASLPGLRLQRLKISYPQWDSTTLTRWNICYIIAQQQDLRKFTIRNKRGIRLNESADWIENCSKLIRLKIADGDNMSEDFVFDGRLLNALTSRLRLRKLVLMTNALSHIGSDFANSRATFDYLHTLKLSLPRINYNRVLEKVTVDLKHLRLEFKEEISSQTLTFISNRFTNLEILELTLDNPTVRVFSEEDVDVPLSPWNFEKLKILQVYIRVNEHYSAHSLARFEAPNLRSLRLGGFNIDATSLSDFVKKFPSVEYFKILGTEFEMYRSDLRIMSDWKNLSCFYSRYRECLQLHRCADHERKFDLLRRSDHVVTLKRYRLATKLLRRLQVAVLRV